MQYDDREARYDGIEINGRELVKAHALRQQAQATEQAENRATIQKARTYLAEQDKILAQLEATGDTEYRSDYFHLITAKANNLFNAVKFQ